MHPALRAPATAFLALTTGCRGGATQAPAEPSVVSAEPSTPPAEVSEARTPPPAPAAIETPPAGLRCLARASGGEARLAPEGWSLKLGALTLPWTDGRALPFSERLDQPDLAAMMALPYPVGEVFPVLREGQDPGRVRAAAYFDALYGASAAEVEARLVRVELGGRGFSVHERVAPALEKVARRVDVLLDGRLELRRYFAAPGGGFVRRVIAGTERPSAHGWGIAVDLDPSQGEYWRDHGPDAPWRSRVPAELVAAFEAEGFAWGGRWRHFDTPHFEYRPELLDPECSHLARPEPAWLDAPERERETLEQRFAPPEGFGRRELAPGSFGAFLRALPLLPPGSPVLSFKGAQILAGDDPRLAAVVEIDVGERDLQQCADSVIRLHAEWALSAGRGPISYPAGDGTALGFAGYLRGERAAERGAGVEVALRARSQGASHAALRAYLDEVFSWVNTGALRRDARSVPLAELRPGDFFVLAGVPFGHAVVVLDVAEGADGRRALLLGQGYMPAQQLHVLRHGSGSPWFPLEPERGALETPFWEPFPFDSLRRMALE